MQHRCVTTRFPQYWHQTSFSDTLVTSFARPACATDSETIGDRCRKEICLNGFHPGHFAKASFAWHSWLSQFNFGWPKSCLASLSVKNYCQMRCTIRLLQVSCASDCMQLLCYHTTKQHFSLALACLKLLQSSQGRSLWMKSSQRLGSLP